MVDAHLGCFAKVVKDDMIDESLCDEFFYECLGEVRQVDPWCDEYVYNYLGEVR
jgi:hypothetical protein